MSRMEQNGIDESTAVDACISLKTRSRTNKGGVPVYSLFGADGKLKTRAADKFGISVLTTALDKMFAAQAASA